MRRHPPPPAELSPAVAPLFPRARAHSRLSECAALAFVRASGVGAFALGVRARARVCVCVCVWRTNVADNGTPLSYFARWLVAPAETSRCNLVDTPVGPIRSLSGKCRRRPRGCFSRGAASPRRAASLARLPGALVSGRVGSRLAGKRSWRRFFPGRSQPASAAAQRAKQAYGRRRHLCESGTLRGGQPAS